jgi:hypothetical protein
MAKTQAKARTTSATATATIDPPAPSTPVMPALAGLNAPHVGLNPEQRVQFEKDQLQAALHRGITHLRQTYGADLTLLSDGAISEKLTIMVGNERSLRGNR